MFDDSSVAIGRMAEGFRRMAVGMDAIASATEGATRGFVSLFDDALRIMLHRQQVRTTAARRRTSKQRKRRHLARARR